MLIQAIGAHAPAEHIICQSPKVKLTNMLGLPEWKPTDSNKYNQNKMKGKAIAGHFLEQSKQTHIQIDRDIADALLHGIAYCMKHLKSTIDYTRDPSHYIATSRQLGIEGIEPPVNKRDEEAPKPKQRKPRQPKQKAPPSTPTAESSPSVKQDEQTAQ